jgi:hypothetical protein
MKYIVIDRMGIEFPIIIPETESHKEHIQPYHKVVSAGFCRFGVNPNGTLGVSCWGESIGLGFKSRPVEDETVILRHNKFSS